MPRAARIDQAIASLGAEATQAGVLVDTGGLLPTIVGARVRLVDGEISTSEGPFGSDQEIVGGYAIFNVQSKQDAVGWAERFMEVHRQHWKGWEGETEVRQVIQRSRSPYPVVT